MTSSLAMLIVTEGIDCAKGLVGSGNTCTSSFEFRDDDSFFTYFSSTIFITVKTMHLENLAQETFAKKHFLQKP